MRGIVLAAGFATRLYPLTRDRAKPLLEVGGRPVLSWLCDRIGRVPDLTEVLVVANARFHDQFLAWRDGYRSRLAIAVLDDGAADNEHRLGGIGDLALALTALPADAEGYLVAAGDNLIEFELAPHAAAFRSRRAPTVLARRIAGGVPPRRHGEVVVDGDGRVLSFREKPDDPRSELAALGIYLLPPAVRDWVPEYLAGGGDADAPGHFLAWLVPREPVFAAEVRGRLFDIGNLESLERARREFDGRAH